MPTELVHSVVVSSLALKFNLKRVAVEQLTGTVTYAVGQKELSVH